MTGTFNWHGGRIDAARSCFGGNDWIDLSTGINPLPWPQADSAVWDWSALPSPSALRDLENAAARYFGVDAANICALPGSEVGLRLLPSILSVPGRHVAPAYRTHETVFPPLDSSDEDRTTPSALLLANPNNPDGQKRTPDEMRALLRRQQDSDQWLIVDEAFVDATPHISLAADVGDGRRLILFRSFGKFFGLAGLRVGFVLGPANIVERYRQRLGDWPIHSAGLAIASAAYRDADWIVQARQQIVASAARLNMLLQSNGLDPLGNCPLFTLIETDAAMHLFERLAHRAILTRPFDYAPRWLRIGLPGTEQAWHRLAEALSDG